MAFKHAGLFRFTSEEANNAALGMAGFNYMNGDAMIHVAGKRPEPLSISSITAGIGASLVVTVSNPITDDWEPLSNATVRLDTPDNLYPGNHTLAATSGGNLLVVSGPTFTETTTGLVYHNNDNTTDDFKIWHEDLNMWSSIHIMQDNTDHTAGNDIIVTQANGKTLTLSNFGVSSSWLIDMEGEIIPGPFIQIDSGGNTIIANKG